MKKLAIPDPKIAVFNEYYLDLAQRELVVEGRAALISARDAHSLDLTLYSLINSYDNREKKKLDHCYQIFPRGSGIDLSDPCSSDMALDHHNLQAQGVYHDKVRAREEQ